MIMHDCFRHTGVVLVTKALMKRNFANPVASLDHLVVIASLTIVVRISHVDARHPIRCRELDVHGRDRQLVNP